MIRRCLNCMNEFSIPDGGAHIKYQCPHCMHIEGTPQKEIYHLKPGTILAERYVIGTVLGFGGFGVTYKAWDNTLGTVVAIKEHFPSGLVQRVAGENSVIIYDGNRRIEYYVGLNRFLDEARNMAKFEGKSNIVNVENFFKENGTAYIVMEFLDGMSLKDYLKKENGKIGWENAVSIMLSVMDAVEELHKASILHRDISPDNIFICKDRIKLIDFGAARFSDTDKEITRSVILKMGFTPPEQYRNKSKQGPWTDIYAIAATMYRLITGKMPDESTNREEVDNLIPPSKLDSQIPEYVSNAIMKGMALNHELRFKNIDEMRNALQRKIEIKDISQEIKWRKSKRVIGIVAAVVLLVVGSLIVLNIYKSKKNQVVLEKAKITIWLCIDKTEDSEEEKQMIMNMSQKFLADQPDISIEIECIPEDEYKNRLENALNTDEMPVLYESDKASQRVIDNGVLASGVYEYLEYGQDEYYFLEEYKAELSMGRQIPLGFNVPVAFVRRGKEANFETLEIKSLSQVWDDETKGYYVAPKYYWMFINSFGGEYTYNSDDTLDDTSKELLRRFQENSAGYGMEEYDESMIMESFVNGSITYYLASAKELRSFNENAAGLYEMRPICTDIIYGEFTDMWSIDGASKPEEIEAAEVLLGYMLAEGPQKTMHIANKNSIPLNKGAYQQFIENNGKYSIIDTYLDKLQLNTRGQISSY